MPSLAVIVLTVASAIITGMVLALLGNLKLVLARRPQYSDSQLRYLLIILNLSLIPLLFAAGLLVDRWGPHRILIAGGIILALSFLALSAALPFSRTLVTVLTGAIGASFVQVSVFLLMPPGLFGPSEVAASLQLGTVFIGLGALITPALLDLLLATIGFRRSMALFAFLFLLPAFLAIPLVGDMPNAEGSLANLLTPTVLAAALVFFVYAPLEAFVSVWTATYFGNLGETDRQARWLATFWMGVMTSRLGFAFLLHLEYVGDDYLGWFLVIPAIFSAVILGNMSGTIRHDRAMGGLIFLGIFLGPVFPMLLGMLFKLNYVRGLEGTTFGFLHAAGSVGSLLLAPLVALSSSKRNIQAALRIPLLIALALAATSLVFVLLARPEG